MDQVTVVGIPGSLRKESHTRRAVALALEGAREVGAHVELLDLRAFDLPLLDPDTPDEEQPDGAQRLRAAVRAAHGVVLGTPEYHGSFSGVLKNALDLCGFDEFEGKMLGVVGVAGGRLGAHEALSQLRVVGRALHAWVVPEQAAIPRAGHAFDARGVLADDRLAERVKEVGRQVARFAWLHDEQRAKEFLKEWEGAYPNPGGNER